MKDVTGSSPQSGMEHSPDRRGNCSCWILLRRAHHSNNVLQRTNRHLIYRYDGRYASDGGSEEDTEVVDSLRCWKGSGKRLSAESSMLEGYRERT
jgi:hypothetical protein